MKPVLYSGGEASRIYDGKYVVRAWFTWPWGQPGEHETLPGSYEDCMDWLARAPHALLSVTDGDTGLSFRVPVERAVIVTEAEAW